MSTLHPLLEAYVPTPADPFDAVKAAHLLNRAGFGGTPEEVAKVVGLGPRGAVDWLMDFPDQSVEQQSPGGGPSLAAVKDYPASFRELRTMFAGKSELERRALRQKLQKANFQSLSAVQFWWMKRMASGPHPLQEKLTLFWHGHFTTSFRDERQAMLLWEQNETLRRFSAGNFHDFVKAVARDPAMLDYLNNNQNSRAHPNENFARELMELFTLGIGNYTETDVKEAARALTGWGHDGDQFTFRRFIHDDGPKTFLSQTGNFDGDDIIRVITEQPVCARFIAGELYGFFVDEEVDDAIAEGLGNILRESKYELRPMLRTMLTSKAFYRPEVIGVQIKSPIQLVVGTLRGLGLDTPPSPLLLGALRLMGQVPLAPPNVKGWPGGRSWINASTLFVRYNMAVRLAGGGGPMVGRGQFGGGGLGGGAMQARAGGAGMQFGAQAGENPDKTVDLWVTRLIQRPIDADKRTILLNALDGQTDPAAIRRMVQLIVSMPEFQLC